MDSLHGQAIRVRILGSSTSPVNQRSRRSGCDFSDITRPWGSAGKCHVDREGLGWATGPLRKGCSFLPYRKHPLLPRPGLFGWTAIVLSLCGGVWSPAVRTGTPVPGGCQIRDHVGLVPAWSRLSWPPDEQRTRAFPGIEAVDLDSQPGRSWSAVAGHRGQFHYPDAGQHGRADHLVCGPSSQGVVLLRADGHGGIAAGRLHYLSTGTQGRQEGTTKPVRTWAHQVVLATF